MFNPAPHMIPVSDFSRGTAVLRRRSLVACISLLVSVAGLSAAIPVLSRLEFIGSGRGLALTLGADAPFTVTVSEKTADKSFSVLSVKCSNVIYGLDEYQFNEFPRGAPLKNITTRENKGNGSIELLIKVLVPLEKTIRIKQKDNRWVILMTSAPVNDFAWSAQNEPGNVAGGSGAEERIVAKNAVPPTTRSGPPTATASSFLEDITILHRERVEKIVFKLDAPTEMIVKSMPEKIMVLFVNTKNSLSHGTFKSEKDWLVKSIELKEVIHGGTAWLGASIFVNRDGGVKPLVQTFPDRLVVYSVRDTKQCLYLWSAKNGTTLSYNFIAPQEFRVDLKKIENRAISDSKSDLGKTGTFSIREPAVQADQPAPSSVPPQRTIRIVVKKDQAALRLNPSAGPSSAIVGHMSFGSIATQLEKKGPWIRIEADSIRGWIAGALVIDSMKAPKALWDKIEAEKIAAVKREEQLRETQRIRQEKKVRQEEMALAKQKAVEAAKEQAKETAKTAAAKREEQAKEAQRIRQEKKVRQEEMALTKQKAVEAAKQQAQEADKTRREQKVSQELAAKKPTALQHENPPAQAPAKPMPIENVASPSSPMPAAVQAVALDNDKISASPQPADSALPKKQGPKLIEYKVYGRDPFLPIAQDEEGPLPNVEKLQVVGILYDHSSRIALLEDKSDKANAFALRENDPVKNGYLLRIQPDKVLFLLNEFGISRTYAMKLNKEKQSSLEQSVGDRRYQN